MTQAPVFFISHGSPMLALEPEVLGPQLQALGQQLSGIKAVLVVSPHWQTRQVQVMSTARPETIHDFGGFPAALYQLQYPAQGHPDCAQEAARLLTAAGFATTLDAQRGLDHGAWVPLYHLLPQAQLPVFQVSMPHSLDTAQALKLGQALAPLRAQGVLIVGSGSMTHNLYEFRGANAQPEPYVQAFTAWVRAAVLANQVDQLVHYRTLAPHAERAHPSEEHFLPLLVALGARATDTAQTIDGGVSYGMLSMESYVWGLSANNAHTPDESKLNPTSSAG
ncbi:class III extradiol ring-cleavage dioxygenase [Rhodoferax sp.]|uniref:DODA-type extradiol aromatic ring-opening family dioxygenase n=1 Tax=Rhodoferax sp. TaxID=50421 RepID=UPI002615B57A|nr:class III extradiol ring-cleavage dioxygenase [Rhodoferax sp.]MDD2924757.1 class III extradiol ring-cleavage dioxygenase [Rhodoferax sp.]